MPRRQPVVRDTRDRILGAALELFAARGHHEVQIPEIVRQAGVSKGAFYYYFRDRRDLVADVHRELWARLRDSAAAAYDPTADAATNLENTFQAYFSPLHTFDEARFFLRDAWSSPDVRVLTRQVREEWMADAATALRRAMDAGVIVGGDAEAFALALIGAFAEARLFALATGRDDETNHALHSLMTGLRM